jgi:NAD(P)-dependent dehydrogenase (short-subunit alcohol dehydrogenase family)
MVLALGNTVIITGRDQAKLDRIKKEHPLLYTVQSDVSDPKAIASLYDRVSREYPALNILINNAGLMRKINLQDQGCDLPYHCTILPRSSRRGTFRIRNQRYSPSTRRMRASLSKGSPAANPERHSLTTRPASSG